MLTTGNQDVTVTFHSKCYILRPYLESAWKMHQNEYKQDNTWSSGS